MPRRFFRKLGRRREALSQRWFLRPFQALLHDPALWSSHRRSVLRALSLGLFIGCLPLPFHMAAAAMMAVFLRINVIVAIAATWISNPVTLTPLFVAAYYLGAWMLSVPTQPFSVELSLDWLLTGLTKIWKPLFAGSITIGAVVSALAYLVLDRIWRISLMLRFRRRRHQRAQALKTLPANDPPQAP